MVKPSPWPGPRRPARSATLRCKAHQGLDQAQQSALGHHLKRVDQIVDLEGHRADQATDNRERDDRGDQREAAQPGEGDAPTPAPGGRRPDGRGLRLSPRIPPSTCSRSTPSPVSGQCADRTGRRHVAPSCSTAVRVRARRGSVPEPVQRIRNSSSRTPLGWFGQVKVVHFPIGDAGCHRPSPNHWTRLFPAQISVTQTLCPLLS